LIHGFGASAYHWRNNIPALSQKYHVYALDLLGFGFSDKPVIDYEVEVWRDQVLSFIREVINRDPSRTAPQPCVVAGNSLGGFTALYAAAAPEAANENLISGCILLNAACRFRPAVQLPQDRVVTPCWAKSWSSALQKLVINLSFVYTKRPSRIAQVLRQVYPVQPDQVDAELVESILMPALHPNAAEVFYRVVSRNGIGPPVYADDLLERLRVPLLLLWGSKVRCFIAFIVTMLAFCGAA
jgi:pimeloyl-ACP methyl ester carboxylesterase